LHDPLSTKLGLGVVFRAVEQPKAFASDAETTGNSRNGNNCRRDRDVRRTPRSHNMEKVISIVVKTRK